MRACTVLVVAAAVVRMGHAQLILQPSFPVFRTLPPTRLPTRAPQFVLAPIQVAPFSIATRPPVSRAPTAPTRVPTRAPTRLPTRPPTRLPTRLPTRPPTRLPTVAPTELPTFVPTSRRPTRVPSTRPPTQPPSRPPTLPPTRVPTQPPTGAPTLPPTRLPTRLPTRAPTTASPTNVGVTPNPTTRAPTGLPTTVPPSEVPTEPPTAAPTSGSPTLGAALSVAPVVAITASPSTRSPTTVSPSTVAPTTLAPITPAPITVAPTLVLGQPTTVAPTTLSPVTFAPTSPAPVASAGVGGATTTLPASTTPSGGGNVVGGETAGATDSSALIYILAVIGLLLLVMLAVAGRRRQKRAAERDAMTTNAFRVTQSKRAASGGAASRGTESERGDDFSMVAKPSGQAMVLAHPQNHVTLDTDMYVAAGYTPNHAANASFAAQNPAAMGGAVYQGEYATVEAEQGMYADTYDTNHDLAGQSVTDGPNINGVNGTPLVKPSFQLETDAETQAVNLRMASIRRINPTYANTPSPSFHGGPGGAFTFSEADEAAAAAAEAAATNTDIKVIPNKYDEGEIVLSPLAAPYASPRLESEPNYTVPPTAGGDPAAVADGEQYGSLNHSGPLVGTANAMGSGESSSNHNGSGGGVSTGTDYPNTVNTGVAVAPEYVEPATTTPGPVPHYAQPDEGDPDYALPTPAPKPVCLLPDTGPQGYRTSTVYETVDVGSQADSHLNPSPQSGPPASSFTSGSGSISSSGPGIYDGGDAEQPEYDTVERDGYLETYGTTPNVLPRSPLARQHSITRNTNL
eukprot:m.67777 g.67777  ORF g.67777 m.67777 type:complete len:798 (-) comp9881_c0_seq2:128-2521(-)